MKTLTLQLTLLMLSSCLFAQVGGNQIFKNNNTTNQVEITSSGNQMVSTDSTLILNATVLLNQKADYYLISVGTNQEAATVAECNNRLTERINRLNAQLEKLGIKKADVYVDFIAQNKMYDYEIEDKIITEVFKGFNIKKNIIIKTKDIEQLDKILELCSKESIFDIIKVEYVNNDLEGIYEELFEEAMKLIEKKKKRFSSFSAVQFREKHRIIADQFMSYNPKDLYSVYNEAFETATINYYSSNFTKKDVRKSKTFYYEGVQTKVNADKVIDNISPFIGIQYVLSLSVLYELED